MIPAYNYSASDTEITNSDAEVSEDFAPPNDSTDTWYTLKEITLPTANIDWASSVFRITFDVKTANTTGTQTYGIFSGDGTTNLQEGDIGGTSYSGKSHDLTLTGGGKLYFKVKTSSTSNEAFVQNLKIKGTEGNPAASKLGAW